MEFSSRMEEELKCPACRRLFTNPVMLPTCRHSLCLNCALRLQTSPNPSRTTAPPSSEDSYPDSDEVSMVSETDSGVVCSSRPDSSFGTASIASLFPPGGGVQFSISCPVCARQTHTDDRGAGMLTRTRALENIVEKYRETKQLPVECQLCPNEEPARQAVQVCEQCEVFYCEACLRSYHPAKGSLAKHRVVGVEEGKSNLQAKHRITETKCSEHPDEFLSLFCVPCKATICCVCSQDGRHFKHQVQPMGAMCKVQKSELSQLLHTLSEKARSGTEFIARLKSMQDRIEANSLEFETKLIEQCDSLIEMIKRRRQQLVANIQLEKVHKQQTFKEQMIHCTSKVHKTTGLLQFSIEALKEPDPSAFLQISSSLVHRISSADENFVKEIEFEPRVSADFELKLDTHSVVKAIQTMSFLEMKVPSSPQILPRESSTENNTVTVVWQPHSGGGTADGYALELDDGNGGNFREVFRGKETICTVEGLLFDTGYLARVKAFNQSGESSYSQCVCLQTAKVAWFSFDTNTALQDVLFSNNNTTITSSSFDDRVVLGTSGLTKGVHYWEIFIDRFENNKDPAIGVARYDVAKDKMLGKDTKGWSIYIDNNRSWLLHEGQHLERVAGGIRPGSTVGVLLDLDRQLLSFYLGGEQHGPVIDLPKGVFYPAVSLNRNVQLTLHSGLDPPVDCDDDI